MSLRSAASVICTTLRVMASFTPGSSRGQRASTAPAASNASTSPSTCPLDSVIIRSPASRRPGAFALQHQLVRVDDLRGPQRLANLLQPAIRELLQVLLDVRVRLHQLVEG